MKIVRILVMSFCIISILSCNTMAIDEIVSVGESWMETGKSEAGIGLSSSILKSGSSEVYNLLLAIATIVAIIVGAILGIQFMTAGIEKKVEVKAALFPYLISTVVVFGSLGIWKLVVTLVGQI